MTGSALLLGCLLGLACAGWLGAVACLRLSTALDRLHAATFVNVAGGAFLTGAAFVADGLTTRSCKVAALVILLVATSAVLSHATGRALLVREGRGA